MANRFDLEWPLERDNNLEEELDLKQRSHTLSL